MARVCMIFNSFELPHVGGPGLQAQRAAVRLMERGHRFIFIAKGPKTTEGPEMVEGIPLYRLHHKGLSTVELPFLLRKLEDQFDVLHVHGVGSLATAAVTFARKHHKRVYVKVTTAGHIHKPLPGGFKGFLKRISPFRGNTLKVLKQADGMIAISQEILGELEINGFPEAKILRIPNGVDTDLFHPAAEAEKQQIRAKLGLPLDKRLFLFTGQFNHRKGVDTLVQAWAQAKLDNAALVLVGEGKGPDSLENWITELTTEHNLQDNVIRTGTVQNVHEYLQAGDYFVFPSWREGLSNSLLEAMASGLICLASDIDANKDLIIPEQTGVLLPPGEVDAWAAAMSHIAAQPQLEFGRNAAARIQDHYSLQRTVEQLEAMYMQDTKPSKGLEHE